MFCYSNNGYSMRSVDGDYIAQEGEVLFSDYATTEQLNAAFPLYNSGVPILSLDEQIALIEEKYKTKLDMYKDLIVSAIADNGANQATKVASFSSKYKALIAQKNAEVDDLYANN